MRAKSSQHDVHLKKAIMNESIRMIIEIQTRFVISVEIYSTAKQYKKYDSCCVCSYMKLAQLNLRNSIVLIADQTVRGPKGNIFCARKRF